MGSSRRRIGGVFLWDKVSIGIEINYVLEGNVSAVESCRKACRAEGILHFTVKGRWVFMKSKPVYCDLWKAKVIDLTDYEKNSKMIMEKKNTIKEKCDKIEENLKNLKELVRDV